MKIQKYFIINVSIQKLLKSCSEEAMCTSEVELNANKLDLFEGKTNENLERLIRELLQTCNTLIKR